MLGDEAHSFLDVFLVGELAEGQRSYKITKELFEMQQASLSWFLSHVSLAAVAPKPALGGPGGWPPLPCSGGALCAPHHTLPGETLPPHKWLCWGTDLPEAPCRGVPGISDGGTDRLPFPGLLLRMPLKCDLGILSKSVDINRAAF